MKKFILLIIEKIRKALKVDEKGNSFGWRKGTLLLAALMMVGCEEHIEEAEPFKGFSIIVIDSCEYLKNREGSAYQGYGYFAHKGNCRFCAERRKQELKELVEQLNEK